MLLIRRDFFLSYIVDQLALLQDKVVSFDGKLAKQQIEVVMGGLSVEAWFDDFEIKSLVFVFIVQVYIARLKSNGKEVVIKVIRSDILSVIKADLKFIYRLVRWVSRLLSDGRRLRLIEVVREYEKILIDELNLLREFVNVIQFRRNFEDSSMFYISEVYFDYCSEGMMVMERIYGISVFDVAALEKNGINMKLLAERGVQVFFIQVFRDSFFYVDMYFGNIFVSYEYSENSKYIGIDCGIVGSLNKEDKRYLVENFIVFFNRDYRKVVELYVDLGWVLLDINVEEFEFVIRTVCEFIFEKSLVEISFGYVLLNLFNTARRFNMEVQS